MTKERGTYKVEGRPAAHEWEYSLKIIQAGDVRTQGPYWRTWAIVRAGKGQLAKFHPEQLMRGVLMVEEGQEDKLWQDALRTLSILRCPITKPLDGLIKELVDSTDLVPEE